MDVWVVLSFCHGCMDISAGIRELSSIFGLVSCNQIHTNAHKKILNQSSLLSFFFFYHNIHSVQGIRATQGYKVKGKEHSLYG